MTERTRQRVRRGINLTAISAALAAVMAFGNWAIDANDRLGDGKARQDSVVVAMKVLQDRVRRLERYAGIKPGASIPDIPRREGIARRLWHILW